MRSNRIKRVSSRWEITKLCLGVMRAGVQERTMLRSETRHKLFHTFPHLILLAFHFFVNFFLTLSIYWSSIPTAITTGSLYLTGTCLLVLAHRFVPFSKGFLFQGQSRTRQNLCVISWFLINGQSETHLETERTLV